MRGWLRIGVVLSVVSIAGVAWSSSGGITGKSGKQGSTCTSCHQGPGKTPTVKIEGPTSLDAGMVAVYTFRMTTDAAITGMNAAATDGVKLGEDDSGTRLELGPGFDDEITHSRTIKPDAATGEAIYRFSMTAPEFGGPISLFAAGNACNGNGQNDGDESATTKLDITINGPPKPEAGVDSGSSSSSSSSSGGVSTQPTADSGKSSDSGSTDEAGVGGGDGAPADDSGCNIGWSDRSSAPAGAMLAGLLALAMVGRKRRHTKR